MRIEEKLHELGIDLPGPSPPVGNYVAAASAGDLVFLSGALPLRPDGSVLTGRLGEDKTVEQGAEAARLATLGLIARLQAEVGDLDRVRRIVKVTGYVQSTPDFTQQAAVINGASDLLAQVFGEAGKHARAAVGCISLPLGAAVEVDLVAQV